DNALRRLGPIGLKLGLFNADERALVERRASDEDAAVRLAETTSITPDQAAPVLDAAESSPLAHSVKIAEVAKGQSISLSDLFAAVGVGRDLQRDAVITAELEIKYAGYFVRERDQAEKLRRMGRFVLDESMPYEEMRSLSIESRQKLAAIRP